MNQDQALREHLLELLDGGHAHAVFDSAVAGLPTELRGVKPPGLTHTPWRLLEHMRLAQWDILKFSTDPSHVSPDWPRGYWPECDAPPDARAWDVAVDAFRSDLQSMKDFLADPAVDLFAKIPQGKGQTVLREALLVADHNAYHLGQLVTVRKLLGAWTDT